MTRARWLLVLCSTFAVNALPTHGAKAEQAVRSATSPTAAASLRIRVLDEHDTTIVGAEVTVKDALTTHVFRTDTAGIAMAERVLPGVVDVALRRIGFEPTTFEIKVEAGDNSFTAHLEGSSVALDEMRIVGGRTFYGRLDDFEQRRARHVANEVITKEEIDKRHPMRLSQMLRAVSGIRIADSTGNVVAVSSRGPSPVVIPGQGIVLLECVLRMAVDGIMRPPLTDIDSVDPNDVYGVEVFLGPSRIPPQFGGMRGDSWCGLISVWTRTN
jgi:hypothetical protein